MPEETLFEYEERLSREKIATYLRTVADQLENGQSIRLNAGNQTVTISPPERPTFEVEAERETSSSGDPGELSIEFELEWDEGEDSGESDSGSTELEIG